MLRILTAASSVAILLSLSGISSAQGATCGGVHSVKSQETLSSISVKYYGSPRSWRKIYNANYKTVGTNPAFILPGQSLSIPCKNSKTVKVPVTPVKTAAVQQPTAVQAPAVNTSAPSGDLSLPKIRVLTGGDYKPFTDQKLPNGGMITDIVDRSLSSQQLAVAGPNSKLSWVNDWAAHLDPLLVNKAFDIGFPWFKPDCSKYDALDKPAKFRCDKFHFSQPVFEILVLFFKRKGTEFTFKSDDDVIGSKICRPSGYFTFDLDEKGRNWVKDKKITLVRPQTVEECFRLLQSGGVDAVALNEFTGKASLKKLSMNDSITTIDKPVSILTLHVVVAKTHEKAKALLAYVNAGLGRIRSNGVYGAIVDSHLTAFWKKQDDKVSSTQ